MATTEDKSYKELCVDLFKTIIELNYISDEINNSEIKDIEELERVKNKAQILRLRRKAIIGTLHKMENEDYEEYQQKTQNLSTDR